MRASELLDSVVIHSIYGAVEDFDRWPAALQAIADDIDAVGGLLVILLPNSERLVISSPKLEAAAQDYVQNWAVRDVRSNRIVERRLELTHNTIVDEDVVSATEMDTDPFYSEFLQRHNLRYFCASLVSPDIGTGVALSLQRSKDQQAFSDVDRRRVLAYSRHVGRALHLHDRLAQKSTAQATLEAVIARHRQMILLVDADGSVVLDNAAAPDLQRKFVVTNGAHRRLNLAALPPGFAQRLRDTAVGAAEGPVAMFLAARNDEPGVAINVLPSPTISGGLRQFADRKQSGHAIITFAETGQARQYDPAMARDFLKITLGEARVAALIASGESPRSAAEKLQLTEKTVRFVLGQIYQKTGLKRQNELAAALARLSLPPAPDR